MQEMNRKIEMPYNKIQFNIMDLTEIGICVQTLTAVVFIHFNVQLQKGRFCCVSAYLLLCSV